MRINLHFALGYAKLKQVAFESNKEIKVLGPMDDSASQAAVRIWVEQDPRSLIQLAPEAVQRAMLALPEELKLASEGQLRDLMRRRPKHGRAVPCFTPSDHQVRLSFWLEYERVQTEFDKKMRTGNFLRGVMGEEYFYQEWLKDQLRVAFLICPPVAYTAQLQEAVSFGLSRLREILSLPFYDDETGKVDVRVADLILKTTLALDMRQNGAITQKIQMENRTLQVSVKAGMKDVNEAVLKGSMAEIDKRLALLEKKELIHQGVHPLPEPRHEFHAEPDPNDDGDPSRGQLSYEEWERMGRELEESKKSVEPLNLSSDNQGRGAAEHGRSDSGRSEENPRSSRGSDQD